ncbi:MAG: SoxR reducing system RseC family protein [Firmicutes bacterium]|nr:SoxR reducing system RseC family protein [Bacillota bacterium]
MQVSGVVTRTRGEWAEVKVAQLAGCASCRRCTLGRAPELQEVTAYNSVGAAKGDEVIVEVDSRGLVTASAWLYLLPVTLLLLGLVVGYRWFGDLGALSGGGGGLLVALALLKAGDDIWTRERFQAKILKKCEIQNTV